MLLYVWNEKSRESCDNGDSRSSGGSAAGRDDDVGRDETEIDWGFLLLRRSSYSGG